MKTRELQKAQGRTEFQNSLRQFFRHSLLIFEMSRHKPSDMPKSHKNHKNKPLLTSTLPAQVGQILKKFRIFSKSPFKTIKPTVTSTPPAHRALPKCHCEQPGHSILSRNHKRKEEPTKWGMDVRMSPFKAVRFCI